MYIIMVIALSNNFNFWTKRTYKCSYINKAFDNHHGSRTITAQLIILQSHYFVFCAWHPHLLRIPKCPKIIAYVLSYCIIMFLYKISDFGTHKRTVTTRKCIILHYLPVVHHNTRQSKDKYFIELTQFKNLFLQCN